MSPTHPWGWRAPGVWLALAAVLLWVLLALIVGGPPNPDSSVFTYAADGLLSGELPYMDGWDHKGPLYPVDPQVLDLVYQSVRSG